MLISSFQCLIFAFQYFFPVSAFTIFLRTTLCISAYAGIFILPAWIKKGARGKSPSRAYINCIYSVSVEKKH